MTTTDVHDLGSFASLKEVWKEYPNGAQTGDYVFIDGVRYNWNKYEYQWFTPIATIDKNIEVFDISTYNFSTNDWRTDLADGEYTVIYDTAAVGRLLKYKDSFFVEGELAVVESKDGSTYTEVVEAETKKSYSKVIYSNLYHKVVYDSSTLIYKVSVAEESLRLTSAEKKIESMQKVDSNLLNSVASLGSRATSLETWQGKIKGKNVLTDLSVNENTEDTLTLTTTSTSLSSGTDTDNEIELPTATTEKAGIMTATDKENVDKVPTLETTAAAHTTKIASLEAKDKTLKDDIDNLAGVVGTHYDETVNNTKNIETNAQKIADNVAAISKANDNITANAKSIEDLQKADKELAENISLVNTELQSAEADIAKHSTRLDTAETAITEHDEKIASTIDLVSVNGKAIDRLNETMGPYTDRDSIILTPIEVNKCIDSTGTKVTKSGWAIAEFTAEKGNVYLFKPGATATSICVFAEKITSQETRTIDYTYTYNDDGTIATAEATYGGKTHSYAYTYGEDGSCVITEGTTVVDALPMTYKTTVGSYSPLVRLNENAELPKDGYCRYMSHFKGNKSITIAVSYKVGVADLTMKVTRDGVLASISTQLGNLSQAEDETRATLEEKTPTMWANVLAVKDTAITVDGQRVELPAYTNVVIKDFKTMSVVRTDSPHPKCIKRFDIHYNGAASIKKLQFGAYYKASDQTNKNYIGMSGVSDLDLSGIAFDGTIMSSAFCCVGAGTLDLKGWNAKPTNIYRLFYGANKVTSLDLAGWDVSAVTDFMWIFRNCSSLTELDVSTWNVSKGTSFYGTFEGCAKLKSLDLSSWETSNCGDYTLMFSTCSTLEALNISKFDMTKLTNPLNMFYGCYMLTDITFGEGFGKATASGLTLDLSKCGSSKSYQLTDNTYNTMLTMYDRATNGLPTMTIKFNAKHNLPDGFIAAMTARGYVISQ